MALQLTWHFTKRCSFWTACGSSLFGSEESVQRHLNTRKRWCIPEVWWDGEGQTPSWSEAPRGPSEWVLWGHLWAFTQEKRTLYAPWVIGVPVRNSGAPIGSRKLHPNQCGQKSFRDNCYNSGNSKMKIASDRGSRTIRQTFPSHPKLCLLVLPVF